MKLIDWISRTPGRVAFGIGRGAGNAPVVDFGSRTEIVATKLGHLTKNFLRTAGYGVSGDGGQALYRRAASEPGHGFKVQSGDGTWWEGIPEAGGVNIKAFGAVGDGVTDDSAPIQAALDFVMAGDRGGAVVFPFAQGESYAIQSTLIVDYTRVGTQTNMVWLRGTGMPDRNKSPAGTITDKGMVIWTGPAGGTMLELVNPLDHKISDIGFHANDLADHCVHQSNVQGGWGGVQVDNVVLQRSVQNLLRYSGAVDGGRNVWTRCTLRRISDIALPLEQEALVRYDNANNVNDQYINCEFIHTDAGNAVGHAFHVSSGSPDISLTGGFTKADVSLYQGTGSGAAFFSATNLYVEGANFYVADKQVAQTQCFVNVQHAGATGNFIQLAGNTNGRPITVVGGYSNGNIAVTNRDDFPVILNGFDLRGGVVTLDGTIGPRTNLIEIGRPASIASTHSWIAAGGFIARVPSADTDGNLNVNLANGSTFHSSRTGGASVNVLDPANVTATEDDGATITIVLHANGVSAISVNWGSAYRFAGGAAPGSVLGNHYSILRFLNVGGVWLEVQRSENIS